MTRKMGKPDVEKAKVSSKSRKEKSLFPTKVYLVENSNIYSMAGEKIKTEGAKFLSMEVVS